MTEHEKALALEAAMAAVQEGKVSVVCRNRSVPRREQAALTRKLFRDLGIVGISVTAPTHAHCKSVYLTLPKRDDHTHSKSSGGCKACEALGVVRRKLEEILARAFPRHDDRSTDGDDYDDSCWTFR